DAESAEAIVTQHKLEGGATWGAVALADVSERIVHAGIRRVYLPVVAGAGIAAPASPRWPQPAQGIIVTRSGVGHSIYPGADSMSLSHIHPYFVRRRVGLFGFGSDYGTCRSGAYRRADGNDSRVGRSQSIRRLRRFIAPAAPA